jgi:hypothetical protein
MVVPVEGFGEAMMILYEIGRYKGVTPSMLRYQADALYGRVRKGEINSNTATKFMELFNKCTLEQLMIFYADIADWLVKGCPDSDSSVITDLLAGENPSATPMQIKKEKYRVVGTTSSKSGKGSQKSSKTSTGNAWKTFGQALDMLGRLM